MSIVVESVSKQFGDFVALNNVSLNVRDGSLTALLGPSGGGKSTLLRVIAGLEAPDSGRVLIAGEDATSKPPQRRNVGFVFQHYAAFKHMTVAKNVAFGLTIRKRPKDEIDARVAELLKLVHLDGFAHRYPVAAVRRPAPAHGAGTRARGAAARAAARRALRRARRDRAQGAAGLAAPAPRRGPRDDGVRHARPGGGDGGRRADRGAQPRRHRAGRHAARPLREARERVRHALRRPGQRAVRALDPPARRGDPGRADRRRLGGPDRPDRPPRVRGAGGAVARGRRLDLGPDTRARVEELELAEGQIVWLRLEAEPVSV